MIKFVPKGWGYEKWLVNKKEYCGKILFFAKGKKCSFHYHKLKDETFYIQSGKLWVGYSMKDCLMDCEDPFIKCVNQEKYYKRLDDSLMNYVTLEPGSTFHVPVGMRHYMYGELDTEMFEFSTQHFDEDSYRILKGD
jgi:quercetin dioxygenase-like cupin family protein